MPIKRYKPTTAGRRGASVLQHPKDGVQEPVRCLTRPLKNNAGRNSSGRITVRHQGGQHKRALRIIDFIKTVEDLYEAIVGTAPQARFGLAFAEVIGEGHGEDGDVERVAVDFVLE